MDFALLLKALHCYFSFQKTSSIDVALFSEAVCKLCFSFKRAVAKKRGEDLLFSWELSSWQQGWCIEMIYHNRMAH